MTSRASHQCHHKSCDSEARWALSLDFVCWTKGGSIWPVTNARSSLQVCDDHREWATEHWVSEGHMDAFAKALGYENIYCPHPRTLKFFFSPIRHGLTLADVLPFG